MENKWYVYKHIRTDKNEIFYIGIGCRKNFARAYDKSIRNDIWGKIVNKTNYTVEIIYENLSQQDAKTIEIELISKYGKIKNGGILSNITNGGDGTSGMLHTDEAKEKIKLKRKEQVFTEEHRENLSRARIGNKNALGKKHSEDLNILKSKNQRGKFGGSIIRTDEFNSTTEYSSILEAAESINTSYKNIWYACTKRKGKLYKGYYWEYKYNNKQIKNNELISYEYLYKEYKENKKTVPKIATELNCSENKIYRLIKKYELR